MDKVLITSMDLPPASHEMWLSDAEGWVTHLDLREDKSKKRAYQLSEQKIGCVSVNPRTPTLILTSSNNRTLKVWDVRKLQKKLSASRMSRSLTSQRGARRRYAPNGNTTSPSLRHTGTRAVGR